MPIDKQALVEQLLAQSQQQRAAQEAAKAERTARLEAMLSERTSTPTPTDLSALASLADSMAGTKIAGGVAQQAKAQQGFQGRTDELLDQLNTLKGESATSSAVPLSALLNDGSEKNAAINNRQQDAQVQGAFGVLAEKVGKTNDAAVDGITQASRLEAAFQTKDPREIGAAMNELARVIQGVKGTMAEGDVNRSFYLDYDTKIKTALEKIGVDGKISDEAIAPVMAQIGRFREALSTTTKAKLARLKDTYKGNDAFKTAADQLEAGGAFNYVDAYLPKAGKAAVTSTPAATPAGGMFGFDPDAALKARTKK